MIFGVRSLQFVVYLPSFANDPAFGAISSILS